MTSRLEKLLYRRQSDEKTNLHKGSPGLDVVGKELGKLAQHILLNLDRRVAEQRLQGLEVGALCQDGL